MGLDDRLLFSKNAALTCFIRFPRRRRHWPIKSRELRGVKVKWTQRVEERSAKNSSNPGTRKDIDNIYLTDTDDMTTVDFVKDVEELYSKTNDNFKDKARKH